MYLFPNFLFPFSPDLPSLWLRGKPIQSSSCAPDPGRSKRSCWPQKSSIWSPAASTSSSTSNYSTGFHQTFFQSSILLVFAFTPILLFRLDGFGAATFLPWRCRGDRRRAEEKWPPKCVTQKKTTMGCFPVGLLARRDDGLPVSWTRPVEL